MYEFVKFIYIRTHTILLNSKYYIIYFTKILYASEFFFISKNDCFSYFVSEGNRSSIFQVSKVWVRFQAIYIYISLNLPPDKQPDLWVSRSQISSYKRTRRKGREKRKKKYLPPENKVISWWFLFASKKKKKKYLPFMTLRFSPLPMYIYINQISCFNIFLMVI